MLSFIVIMQGKMQVKNVSPSADEEKLKVDFDRPNKRTGRKR